MEDISSKRILIVEDARDIQMLLSTLLEGEGYIVFCKDNGKEAMDYLINAEPLPQLILLDLMMPQMNGFQFREEQKKHVHLSKIPIVIMTADGEIHSKSMKLDTHGYLKKPFADIPTILQTVGKFFPN